MSTPLRGSPSDRAEHLRRERRRAAAGLVDAVDRVFRFVLELKRLRGLGALDGLELGVPALDRRAEVALNPMRARVKRLVEGEESGRGR